MRAASRHFQAGIALGKTNQHMAISFDLRG
jgi:hypothetical protein